METSIEQTCKALEETADHSKSLILLNSIVVSGNRTELHRNNIIPILLQLLESSSSSSLSSCNVENSAATLNLLSQVLDDSEQLTSDIATLACRHTVAAMKLYPENRDILAGGAAVIWVCAGQSPTECLGEGAYGALEAASKVKKHFANLEVGSRHPFRFKLGIISAALSRLTET